MTTSDLRRLTQGSSYILLRTLQADALALIDLYDGEDCPDLPIAICEWGKNHGLISQTEYELLHGMMTLHEQPPHLQSLRELGIAS